MNGLLPETKSGMGHFSIVHNDRIIVPFASVMETRLLVFMFISWSPSI